MSYKIGSFNVRNLAQDNGKNLRLLAEIIRKEDFDIIALQEVLGEGQVLIGSRTCEHSLKRELCDRYEIRWGYANVSPRFDAGEVDKRGEGYAFLWKKRRIELPQVETENGIRVFEPRIWNQYSLDRSDGIKHLLRNPFYGRFRIKHLQQEFRLITTHIRFGKGDGEDEIAFGEQELRRGEYKILAGSIYPRIHDKIYGPKEVRSKPATTIMLGDYNLNLPGSKAVGSYMNEILFIDNSGKVMESDYIGQQGRKIITRQKELSTLKRDEQGYKNNYDHFSYQDGSKADAVIRRSRAITVEELGMDFEEYRKEVSDHLPIVIEISFRQEES